MAKDIDRMIDNKIEIWNAITEGSMHSIAAMMARLKVIAPPHQQLMLMDENDIFLPFTGHRIDTQQMTTQK